MSPAPYPAINPWSKEPITAVPTQTIAQVTAQATAQAEAKATATATGDTSIDPPLTEMGKLAAIDTVMLAHALETINNTFAQIGGEIGALTETVAEHEERINRLDAAVRCLDCPNRTQDPTTKDETVVLTVGACINAGSCTCDLGHALVYSPPTEGDEYQSAPG